MIAGGVVSDRKGVNVPGVVLPLSALTEKDRADLDYGLTLGIDWVALSFVQRPEDIVEIKAIVKGRAQIVAKLEKSAAISSLDAIVAEVDVLEMSDWACQTAKKEGLGKRGDTIVISAGVPFGTSGTTNLMRIAQIS